MRQLALTKLLSEAGVPMMTGTDREGQAPGQSLTQEFDELGEAALSPLKILQMTALYPTRLLGRTTPMGSSAIEFASSVIDGSPPPSATFLIIVSGGKDPVKIMGCPLTLKALRNKRPGARRVDRDSRSCQLRGRVRAS
jgi:hypothetical protein